MERLTATSHGIARAVDLLRAGELVAIPTETVYGLAADASADRAVIQIFAAKGRPRGNPLIAHVASLQQAQALVEFSPLALQLAEQFWPGPLTLVLPRTAHCAVSLWATTGLNTLAVRMPAHATALAVLRAFGAPLVAPSANPSGHLSPTCADHVDPDLASAVVDGGKCAIGLESTIVQISKDRAWLLRPGGISTARLEAICGPLADGTSPQHPRSPGQFASHYAPRLPLRINATTVQTTEAALTFGAIELTGAATALNLSQSGDLNEAAANLFAFLRLLDNPRWSGIAAMPIPDSGIGQAINDRLRRAAHR
ncbi:MAG: threonylcarbamoyl-AMP synthase [Myxococcales bacterium]|nr:threonylcarbamoyl-AMP synthase [Myxococcales bacterium]